MAVLLLLVALLVPGAVRAAELGSVAPPVMEPPDLPLLDDLRPGPDVRVLVYQGDGPVEVAAPGGLRAGEAAAPSLRLPEDLGEGDWEVRADGPITVSGRGYRGWLYASVRAGRLTLVNHVPLEEYLRGVVPRELLSTSVEAVKAQAVVARTYTLAHLKGPESPYDVEDGTRHQVYGGVEAEHEVSDRAVRETEGLVLVFEGALADRVLYHSTCGGHTAANEEVFPGGKPIPYLRGVRCAAGPGGPDYCQGSKYHRWEAAWGVAELSEDLRRSLGKGLGPIAAVEPQRTTPSGRVTRVRVVGPAGEVVLRGDEIRRLLGYRGEDGRPRALPSTRFEVEGLRVRGSGWGHGVGLCQWGAIGMAREGKGFREILRHYYNGAEVEADPDLAQP